MKQKTVFVCQECGGQQQKWMGWCPDCGVRKPLVEEEPEPQGAPAAANHRYGLVSGGASAKLYSDIQTSDAPRISSGIAEFDRVLGGGIVPGALVLLGGEPGIGKSTLLLQVASHVARNIGPVLYSSGEESEHQIKLRGERLAVDRAPLYLLAETCLERILEEIERLKPSLVIVDSIQTIFSSRFQSAPGSIGQVREVATHLLFAVAIFRSCWSATLPRMAALRARKRSSTSSTPFCTLKGSAITRTGSSARSRIASARRASSGCSR
jgi:DNA repair protein RadA/Sms